MNYLYIPTTTLNFNNIFSTETISPAGFYVDRGFGYRFFERVPPSPFNNVILLYDRYPLFDIQDDGRDHYPMVFRIQSSSVSMDALSPISGQNRVSGFSFPKTLYLNPASVEVYFRTEKEMSIALTKAEPSLTTKMIHQYEKKFLVFEQDDLEAFEWDPQCINEIQDQRDKNIREYQQQDRCIDRLKGFSYGYILGACKSITSAEASIRSWNRDSENSLSSFLNNPASGFAEDHKNIIRDAFREYMTSCQDPEKAFMFNPSQHDSIKLNNMLIERVSPKERAPKTAPSLITLVNSYCLNCDLSGQFSDEKMKIATDIGMAIREIVGSKKWDGSEHRKYINALLNNVKSGSKFDFKSYDHLAMQSIAAFILKGDNLENLEDFLIANGVGDLRLAFALWGAMFGFSKIPKTQYDLLFLDNDSRYAEAIYDQIHAELARNQQMPTHPINPVPPITTAHPEDDSLVGELRSEFPGIDPWVLRIQELLQKFGGITKKFNTAFRYLKVTELGKLNGIAKKDVDKFFKDRVCKKKEACLPGIEDSKLSSCVAQRRFPSDPDSWSVTSSVLSQRLSETILSRIKKKRFEWFASEWAKPDGKYYGSQSKNREWSETSLAQRTNREAIEAFCRNLDNTEKENIRANLRQSLKTTLLEKFPDY